MIARAIPVPKDALLNRYVETPGAYTDCFEVMSPLSISHDEFLRAFYTTWLFRLERVVLSIALRRWIRDNELDMLVRGRADAFAVWYVEDRRTGEILLRDKSGRTCSYLAVSGKSGGATRLIFGSTVFYSNRNAPWWLAAVIPAHVIYSKALLRAAELKTRKA
ncbi:MAG: hypothetical protein AAF755_06885 [Pseudomonadota bacterium]